MLQDSSELVLNLDPEILRSKVEQNVSDLLKNEQSFDGRKYGALDLPASALAEWENRPVIDQTVEPLVAAKDIQIILVSRESKKEAYKSVQLHITPYGERPTVKHVYILNLPQGKAPELISYVNRPVSPWFSIDEPAPMIPANMSIIKASPSVIKVFGEFLDKAKGT